MKFFYYCFYRLTNAYKVLDGKDPEIYARGIVTLCQSLNLLSLLSILFIINNSQYSIVFIGVFMILNLIVNLFILTKKKYIELEERWKEENFKCRKTKLYLIWLYVIASIVTYMVMLSVMS